MDGDGCTILSRRQRPSPGLIIAAVCVNLLTHTMLYGFILPVLPTALVDRISIPADQVGRWIGILLTLEALATLITSPLVGFWTKFLHGSQRLALFTGIILLVASMAVIAVSDSIGVLVAGRIIQGVSSAIIQVVCLTVILACSPEDAIGQSMGYAGAAMNLGFLAGPLLGGVLYRFLDWKGLFGVVNGILAVNLFVPLLIIPLDTEKTDENDGEEDSHRPLTHSPPIQTPSAETTLLPSQADTLRDTTPFSLSTLHHEPKMRIGIYAVIVSGIFISAIDTVLPVFVENQFHWNSLGQGLIFLPVSLPALFEPIYGWLTDKYGARIIGFLSFLGLVPSTLCLGLITSDSITSKILLFILLASIGGFLDATEPAGYVLMDEVLDDLQAKSGGDWKHILASSFGLQNSDHYFGLRLVLCLLWWYHRARPAD